MIQARLHSVHLCLLGLFVLIGCGQASSGSDEDEVAARLELQMLTALDRFQNAENHFGPSTTIDKLQENSHWMERMLESLREIEGVELQATNLGVSTDTISSTLRQRCQRHFATLQSDSTYLQMKLDFETANEILDGL